MMSAGMTAFRVEADLDLTVGEVAFSPFADRELGRPSLI